VHVQVVAAAGAGIVAVTGAAGFAAAEAGAAEAAGDGEGTAADFLLLRMTRLQKNKKRPTTMIGLNG
jgi:hypothetical protein